MAPRDHFSIRIDPEIRAAIEAIAEDEGRTQADVIRRLLAEAITARKKR